MPNYDRNLYAYDSLESEPGILESLKLVFIKRRLIFILAKNDILSRYKRSVLGILWAQINPLLTTTVIFFVFGKLINQYTPLKQGYAVYVYTGILFQIVLINGLTQTGEALASSAQLLLRTRVKPIIFSYSASLGSIINFLLGFVLVFPIAIASHVQLSYRIVFLPLICIFLANFLTGVGLFLSGFYIRFDDFKYLMGAFMMIAAYLSPIFYPLDILSESMRAIVSSNPLTSWIVVIRWLCIENAEISKYNLIVVVLSQLIFFILGTLWIRKRWRKYMVML